MENYMQKPSGRRTVGAAATTGLQGAEDIGKATVKFLKDSATDTGESASRDAA